MKRKSIGARHEMIVQPTFIIGTFNQDGTPDFAPITWVSKTCEEDDTCLIVISMYGTKQTKQNVLRTGQLTVNLATSLRPHPAAYADPLSGIEIVACKLHQRILRQIPVDAFPFIRHQIQGPVIGVDHSHGPQPGPALRRGGQEEVPAFPDEAGCALWRNFRGRPPVPGSGRVRAEASREVQEAMLEMYPMIRQEYIRQDDMFFVIFRLDVEAVSIN